MSNQEPQKILDETPSTEESSGDRIVTANLAATGVMPTKSKSAGETKPMSLQAPRSDGERIEMLFDDGEADGLRSRWNVIQTEFVDEPRRSVEEADELVAAVMKRLAEVFAAERENLEQYWRKGDHISTEDLRVALRRYRAFFDRLLSV